MSKVGFSGGIKLHGNINRILEMSQGGMGDNAISGHFKDEGVNISPQFVRSIRTEVHEASKKAVTKASAKKAIKASQKDRNGGSEPSGLPA
ncbi:hypothetical protein R7M92_20985 [Vibrio sp. Vb2880]|uniref:hypothetical protein n=1 Tax=Vibrio TaxID=662 RepID=UPI0011245CC4|nr:MULTISPECIES: hypothetical protein [Vibrio]MBE4182960.1 hypothetical protein [Vibrio parahaemolyticus]MDW1578242.1 hypothetical protein [Vibrio sp. Vb2880]TOP42895.1 hypothetical protein CGH15_14920 [Vibrio parahaemolyticus]HCE1932522.1 hypothetical protein [Vibrio parahaemolyticus]HCG8324208.1 hypothetical protein [Vibrio parahaemolyticus]